MACAAVAPGALAQARPASPGTLVTETTHFAFHSDPWINLHHFLYQWAREDEGIGKGRLHVPVPERPSLAILPDAERTAWEQALAFYRRAVARQDHLGEPMRAEKRALLAMAGDVAASPPDLIAGIADALATAMPIYLARWWPVHDSANRRWVAQVVATLRRHEARYVELTERIYGAAWPAEPLRVDVSAYANTRAGYTADGHTVIFSTDAGNQGLYGLETLLHEVQHTAAVGQLARERLQRTFDGTEVAQPSNLWHAIIFATAGEFVRSIAVMEELPAYTPYAVREGFEELQGWAASVRAAREDWLPVVRGEAGPDSAMIALAERFTGR